MASLRRRISTWRLTPREPSEQSSSTEANRGSMDSGYHSLSQKSSQSSSQALSQGPNGLGSPETSNKRLRKTLSTTFDLLAGTARSVVEHFHQESSAIEDNDFPNTNDKKTPSGTPTKSNFQQSSIRKSFMTSMRSRKRLSQNNAEDEVVEPSLTPNRLSSEKAPTLDVHIPTHTQHENASGLSTCGAMAMMTGIQPTSSPASLLFPSTIEANPSSNDDEDPFQDTMSARVRCFVDPEFARKEKGYIADTESDPETPWKETSFDATETPKGGVSSHCGHPHLPAREDLGGEPAVPTPWTPTLPLRLKKGIISLRPDQHSKDPSSFTTKDDGEPFQPSPEATPSMGSRITFDQNRAERELRYRATVEDCHSSDADTLVERCSMDTLKVEPIGDSNENMVNETKPPREDQDSQYTTPSDASARFLMEAVDRKSGEEMSEDEDPGFNWGEPQTPVILPIRHLGSTSSISEITTDGSATKIKSCVGKIHPPYPSLDVDFEPTDPHSTAEDSAMMKRSQVPLTELASTGLVVTPPSSYGSPEPTTKAGAPRMPLSSSSGNSIKLRSPSQKQIERMDITCPKVNEYLSSIENSPKRSITPPRYGIKSFQSPSSPPSAYMGHELDPIPHATNPPDSAGRPSSCSKKSENPFVVKPDLNSSDGNKAELVPPGASPSPKSATYHSSDSKKKGRLIARKPEIHSPNGNVIYTPISSMSPGGSPLSRQASRAAIRAARKESKKLSKKRVNDHNPVYEYCLEDRKRDEEPISDNDENDNENRTPHVERPRWQIPGVNTDNTTPPYG